jgi:hypothetical protein
LAKYVEGMIGGKSLDLCKLLRKLLMIASMLGTPLEFMAHGCSSESKLDAAMGLKSYLVRG